MLTFVVVTKISIKNTEGKMCFLLFSVRFKIAIFVVVEIQMLIFCKNPDFFVFIGDLNWKNLLVNAHN